MSNKVFSLTIVGMMILISLILYPSLPEQVTVHWTVQGTPDTFAPKTIAVWLVPALTVVLLLVAHSLMMVSAFQQRYSEAAKTHDLTVNAILVFLAFTHTLMLVLTLKPELLLIRIFIAGMGVIFATLGNVMGRLRPNPLFGFRIPWTIGDETVWRRTHRAGGRWFFMSGMVIMVAAFAFPLNLIFVLTMGLLFGGVFCVVYYSRGLWLERHSRAS